MKTIPKEIQLTPKQLRQMQLIQLEILIEFDRICRENGIKYSLDGGTLLGAVRHKGFIPWDEDIDVIMLRSEYERFFEVCQRSIDKDRFFLQEYRTDPNYRWGYSRILRKGTVYNRAGHEHMKYKRGVFIDLFILDNVPDYPVFRYLHYISCFFLRKALWSEAGKVLHPKEIWKHWYSIISIIPRDLIFSMINQIAVKCNKKRTKLVRYMTYPFPKRCKYGVKRSYFEELIEVNFEGYSFLAPKDYIDYLTDKYGNFIELPPIEKRKPNLHLSKFVPVEPRLSNEELLKGIFI